MGLLAAALLFGMTAPSPGATESRVALVIGNSNYKSQPLSNPKNDARDVERSLKKLGFDVIKVEDGTQRAMTRAITSFGEQIKGGSSVALFYYAGHGIQVGGRNYLIPVDAEIGSEASVLTESVDLEQVLTAVGARNAKVSVVILDACRNNPFERRFRGSSGGLAQVTAPGNMLISYATAPGQVAADGNGRNGTFTGALLQHLHTPGLRLEDVFKKVRSSVTHATGGRQTPWESSSLVEDFFFVPSAPVVASEEEKERALWAEVKDSRLPGAIEYFLSKYPKGQFAAAAQARLKEMRPSPPAIVASLPTAAAGGAPGVAALSRDAATSRRFDVAALPNKATQILDAAKTYDSGAVPKAMAISRNGSIHYVTYTGGSLDIEEYQRRALQGCVMLYGECTLYALNENLVFDDTRWAGRHLLPSRGDVFNVEKIPFVTENTRKAAREYTRFGDPKAFAVSVHGMWGWASRPNKDQETANREALERCQKHVQGSHSCFIYAVGEQVVMDNTEDQTRSRATNQPQRPQFR